MPDFFPVRTPNSASVSETPYTYLFQHGYTYIIDCQVAVTQESTQLHMSVFLLSEEETSEAGPLGGADPPTHESDPECSTA